MAGQLAVALRVDAGPGVGLGHLFRCAALGEVLQRVWGADVTALVMSPLEEVPPAVGDLAARLFPHVVWLDSRRPRWLPAGGWDTEQGAWYGWRVEHRGRDWQRLIVVDRADYRVPPLWGEAMWTTAAEREVLAAFVDDLAPGGPLDVAINPNAAWAVTDWSRLDKRAEVLAGPRFACLWHPPRYEGREWLWAPRTLLVTLGGSDPHGETAAVVRKLAPLLTGPRGQGGCGWAYGQVDIVLGPAMVAADQADVHDAVNRLRGVAGGVLRVHEQVQGLGPLIEAADVAISAGGGTLVELACGGVPALVLPQTPAEVTHAWALERAGTCVVTTLEALVGDLVRLVYNAPRRARMAAAGWRLVDGGGAARVAAALVARAQTRERDPAEGAAGRTGGGNDGRG